jgi:hypothetical protein
MTVDAERCAEMAAYFADVGRIVPGIAVEADGRAR